MRNTNTTVSAVGDSEKSFSIVTPDSPFTSKLNILSIFLNRHYWQSEDF